MPKPYQDQIDKAIAALTELRNRRISTSVKSHEAELDSYHDAKQMAMDAHMICADLIIGLCELASECANEDIGADKRKEFRDPHLIIDALNQADQWAEEYAHVTEAA